MALTSIRVRGKRGKPKRSNLASSNLDTTPTMADQPELKRRKLHHTKVTNGRGGMLSKEVPWLLQLPQELLEQVFIASKNLSLRQANHELRRRLSTESVKHQLVTLAFGPTWDAWYGIENYALHSYAGWGIDVDRIEGDPAFQSTILACSWAKIDLLLTAYEVWDRSHARGRAYFTIPEPGEVHRDLCRESSHLYAQTYHAIGSGLISKCTDKPSSPPNMSLQQKLYFDLTEWQRLVGDLQAMDPLTASWLLSRADVLLGTHLEIHPGTAIPDDVLSGPFESEVDGSITKGEEKAFRLLWLVRGGARLQAEQTWETTQGGFEAIVRLVTGTIHERFSEADVENRLGLAMHLFVLFDVLCVFEIHWPKYILATNGAKLQALIPTMPSGSKQKSELGFFLSSMARRRLERPYLPHSLRWQGMDPGNSGAVSHSILGDEASMRMHHANLSLAALRSIVPETRPGHALSS